MGHRKLQLNLLSQSGELINCVSCFAGQVSVFRAPSYAALEVYQRALAGVPGPERISILLDDKTFIPSEHFFVGFGELQECSNDTILETFLSYGQQPNAVASLLSSYDIAIDAETRWSDMSKCEARRARLLLATRSRSQVIILNDPLEPLANQWRERFAEILVLHARTNKEIVVVTNLSYRPESWIDNQSIARIQVGEEIQRTIGFGAQSGQGNELVAQLRQMMKEESNPPQKAPQPKAAPLVNEVLIQSQPATHNDDDNEPAPIAASLGMAALFGRFGANQSQNLKQNSLAAILSSPVYSTGVAVALIIGGGIYLLSGNSPESETVASIAIQEPEIAREKEADAPSKALPVTKTQVEQAPSEPPVVAEPPAITQKNSSPLVLDEYPDGIKKSILVSFQGLGISSAAGDNKRSAVTQDQKAAAKNDETGDLLKLLATASDSGEGLPDRPPPSEDPDNVRPSSPNQAQFGSEEEKREAIRKRFLEAIERAQSMRRQQQEDQ